MVSVFGRVDQTAAPELRDAVRVAGGFSCWVVIHLHQACFLEASAAQMLFTEFDRVHNKHTTICLVAEEPDLVEGTDPRPTCAIGPPSTLPPPPSPLRARGRAELRCSPKSISGPAYPTSLRERRD